MHESAEQVHHYRTGRATAVLWFAVLAGPGAWIIGLNADYSLVRVACATESMLPLHLVTLVTLAVAAAGALAARREWRRAGAGVPGEGGSPAERARFMSAIGLLGAAFFALVILAQWAAKLFLDPCVGL